MKQLSLPLKAFFSYLITAVLLLIAIATLLSPIIISMTTGIWWFLLMFTFSWYVANRILKVYDVVYNTVKTNIE